MSIGELARRLSEAFPTEPYVLLGVIYYKDPLEDYHVDGSIYSLEELATTADRWMSRAPHSDGWAIGKADEHPTALHFLFKRLLVENRPGRRYDTAAETSPTRAAETVTSRTQPTLSRMPTGVRCVSESSRRLVAEATKSASRYTEVLPYPEPLAFHFTDRSNVTSILQLGLMSLKMLTHQRIDFKAATSEESRRWDLRGPYADYVRLSPQRNHPMAWHAFHQRGLNVAWIEIDTTVLNQPGVLYASSNVIQTKNRPAIDNNPRTALGGDSQAEILVPFTITPGYLRFNG